MGSSNVVTNLDEFLANLPTTEEIDTPPIEGKCARCPHHATMEFEWAPGHMGGLICDCCIRKVWEETLENVTQALAEQVVACPKEA